MAKQQTPVQQVVAEHRTAIRQEHAIPGDDGMMVQPCGQAGEWTGDPKTQVKGAAKQAEGKVQNAWGQAKDAAKQTADDAKASKPPQRVPEDADSEESIEEKRARG